MPIDRRTFVSALGAGVLGATLPRELLAAPAKAKRPNVLFIAVDDLRPQLGCYGFDETLSPHIDALAVRGTIFERAYCNVPVCGPSRVGMLTGLRTNAGQWSTKNLKQPFTTLPALFKKHGYHTISNGKVLHTMADRAEDWSEAPWRSVEVYYGKGDWAGYNKFEQWQYEASAKLINPKSKRGPYMEAADVPDSAYQDGKVADKTIADLKRMKEAGKPFFIAAGFWRPHLPFNAPKKYWDMYKREDVALAANRFKPKDVPAPCRTSGEIDRYGLTGKRKETEEFHREARHAYYACVSYVDAQVGKVMKALDDLGLADDTIVVLWGDHGWNLGEHNYWGKHNTLHNSLHIPLIVCAPGTKGNQRTLALVESIDIYPTLCELAGISAPKDVHGKSFLPLMEDPKKKWKQAVFAKWSGCEAVKTDRYLYTEWQKKGEVTHRMLYDHKVDPQENVNIAGRAEAKAVVEAMSKLLQAQRTK